jgi:glycosyltransferase involved in cell wall biosynthesis
MKSLILTFNSAQAPTKVTSHHLAEYLLRNNFQVLYISDAISPFHLLKSTLFRSNLSKIISTLTTKIDYQQNFISIIPFTFIPIRNNFPFSLGLAVRLHANSMSSYFRKIIDKFLCLDRVVDLIWINNPKYYQIVEETKYRKLVYSIEDSLFEFSAIPDSLKDNHLKLLQKADIITVTSEPLFREVQPLLKIDSKLILLRNGVEFQQFSQIDNSYLASDPEFSSIPKPRVIYIGAISYWFDFDLLVKVANSLPSYSFVLIGPADVSIDKLKKTPNIYWLGAKPHTKIQNYLQESNIGIIPFVRTKLIESVNPIKLYEYMAAGLPVVSTTWNEIASINSPAFLAQNSDEFTQYLVDLLLDPNSIDKQSLLDFAKFNSWENRFAELMKILAL